MPDPGKTKAALRNAARDYGHRFADVVSFLTATGWKERIKGSHHIFTRSGVPILIHFQEEKGGNAKAYQVRQVRQTLGRFKLWNPQ